MDAAEKTKNTPDLQCLPSLCRGLYNRVAQKLGCDPSYVSRVARRERRSKIIEKELRRELSKILKNIGQGGARGADDRSQKGP